MAARVKVGLVMGDAAGIGPEIALKTIADPALDERIALYVLGSVDIMTKMNQTLGNPVQVSAVAPPELDRVDAAASGKVARVLECDLAPNPNFTWGVADGINGANTIRAIRRLFDLNREGVLDGAVIGPLDKKAMKLGGSTFPDEMALMQSITGSDLVKSVVKWNNIFRSSVVGHVRFSEILANLTPQRIDLTVRWLGGVMQRFGITEPRIGVAAINPHAGEGGEFGDEEITILTPAIERFAKSGLRVTGPYPADTILHRALNGQFEGIVFLYHDQGNIALKAASFGESVMIYGGLPLPVTGVGHGVAYGRAGQGRADHRNLLAAINAAAEMAVLQRG